MTEIMLQGHKVTRSQNGENEKVGYRKLIVWQKADELAYQIYLVTKLFPKDERFGLTSQLRRAALSVPTNIVEGSGRQNKGELRYFLNVALGSIFEVEYLLNFCSKLGYLKETESRRLENARQYVGALLWKFYKAL